MAGCYHDQEEFESDLTIEVAREGDILKEGQGLDEFEKCDKNPGHRDFIPFKDLTLEHLPSRYRNTETLDNLKQKGSRVVRLVVRRNLGSGYVYRDNNQYHIITNNHVVKTEDEVKHCTVEFHYDGDSRSSVFTSRGVELLDTDPYRDTTIFTFHPVPDFLHQLDYDDNRRPYINIMLKNNQIKSRSTFPSPRDLYSTYLNLNISDIYLMFISYPDGSIGYINSCYFKFEPIPSSIKELSSVEVYIDEDDGESRKIRGDVVKFGDGFVVRVQDSITQDKVKKCSVVWNDEVIGRGTRLYFKQCKIKDVFNMSGIDEDWSDRDFWEFNFHPKKVSDDRTVSDDVCCIGHPHGAIKHITFGIELGRSLEKFDNQLRHIKDPRSDCRCMEVSCLNYSCKTCPGSSGSPVFKLWNLDTDFYYTHFMGESVKRVINGEQIENINRAWTAGVDMNRKQERIYRVKKAMIEFEDKIPDVIPEVYFGEGINEEIINLLEQAIRDLEAKIADVTASTSNSSGEGSNDVKQNSVAEFRTYEILEGKGKYINVFKRAIREFKAGATASTSKEEQINLLKQAIIEHIAETEGFNWENNSLFSN